MNEAVWVLIGTVVGGLLSAGAGWLMQSRQFRHEERMHAIANQGRERLLRQCFLRC